MKPYTFATKKAHVLYVVQHLDSMAKQHFCHYIEAGGTDPKVTQWTTFTLKLNSIFSNPDCTGKASGKLLALCMKETGCVHHFTVLFRESADELGWPNSVLHCLYYNGLLNCIKDLWARTNPPANLEQLIQEAQCADNHYWKHVEEKKSKTTPTPSSQFKPTSTSTSTSKFTPKSSTSQPSASNTSTNSSSHPASTPVKDKAKDLTKILGPDSKLLPEEKAHHEKLGLCFYCAEKHSTDQCLKRTPGKPFQPSASTSTLSKSTSNTSSSSKPKGHIVRSPSQMNPNQRSPLTSWIFSVQP